MTRYGSAQTLQQWAERAATLPAALVEATPRAVVASARVLDEQVTTNLRTATGGDMRLSRVRSGKGARITTTVRTRGAGSRTRAEVVPGGPVMLVEEDTRRHREPFQYGQGRRYAMEGEQLAGGGTSRRKRAVRARAMNIPGVGWRMRVNHPGTKGKRPVRNAFRQTGATAGEAGVLIFRKAVRDHLAG